MASRSRRAASRSRRRTKRLRRTRSRSLRRLGSLSEGCPLCTSQQIPPEFGFLGLLSPPPRVWSRSLGGNPSALVIGGRGHFLPLLRCPRPRHTARPVPLSSSNGGADRPPAWLHNLRANPGRRSGGTVGPPQRPSPREVPDPGGRRRCAPGGQREKRPQAPVHEWTPELRRRPRRPRAPAASSTRSRTSGRRARGQGSGTEASG